MSLKKYNDVLTRTAKASGKSKAAISLDMIKCARKYGAGYYDYLTFGFWDLTDEQRDTYVTRLRSKKIISYVNDDRYGEFFDDKEAFNGPLDCSLPSLADLLLTSAESWLVGLVSSLFLTRTSCGKCFLSSVAW